MSTERHNFRRNSTRSLCGLNGSKVITNYVVRYHLYTYRLLLSAGVLLTTQLLLNSPLFLLLSRSSFNENITFFSDTCCTITLCDVTLGDHELKPENPAEISVNLTDVKVLNSTAIKLKLSTKTPENVTIELSEDNHVWRQVKPDKGEQTIFLARLMG